MSEAPLMNGIADKGYDYLRWRRYLYRRGIEVRIARLGPPTD
ncbi:hypothetical protein BC739_001388 [Kutzneria viridogrisea]|uniref:Transposase DDE domain-containing protein n=1 Tax=Kutzneria viridogrisea TaxID=47990 RepID=A0ABR6BBE1_9PSEU|nr:hypothetical protein [Kutzneria viridogrisea]